jgi:hypothetical protein
LEDPNPYVNSPTAFDRHHDALGQTERSVFERLLAARNVRSAPSRHVAAGVVLVTVLAQRRDVVRPIALEKDGRARAGGHALADDFTLQRP